MIKIRSLRIISNKVDMWAFKISLGIIEYAEGFLIEIDLLYLPSILQVCPDILEDFKNGAGEFYLITELVEEQCIRVDKLEYEMESVPYITTKDKHIYDTRISYERVEQKLLEFSAKLEDSSKWNPLAEIPQIFEIFSIIYFVGYLKQIPLDILRRGKGYKECQEIQNP